MTINIIVAFSSKNFGTGCDGAMPWYIPEDLARFSRLTRGSTVVMGRKTWESLPAGPLFNRLNVVVTRNPMKYGPNREGVVFVTPEELDGFLNEKQTIFIIGGEWLYGRYMGRAEFIYATIVNKDVKCDSFFPITNFHKYEIHEYYKKQHSDLEDCEFQYITYKLHDDEYKYGTHIHEENQYLELMNNLVKYGNKRPDRTEIGTMSIFGPQMRFDISKCIPVITTKFTAFKTILKELLFFLRGETDSKKLEQQGVGIWKANTSREFLDKRGLTNYTEGYMGPMYGCNWRNFNGEYCGLTSECKGGYDQLEALVEGLKNDPYSRRHMMTTYNPATVDQCVLAPCHGIVTQFYVEDGGKLSCHVYCRSSDTFLGLPFNIASYAALTYIIAKKCDMAPKELIISMGDAHVYLNHLDQVDLQLNRNPLPFPVLEVNHAVKDKEWGEITVDDFHLVGYLSHPAIKAPMAV